MQQLLADLAPLEVPWNGYDWGRFPGDGIQHTRRDGSVIVITDEGPNAGWLVGFYTAAQHDDCSLHDGATYVECATTTELIACIVAEVTR